MSLRWRELMRQALSVDGGRDGVAMMLALCDERESIEHRAAAHRTDGYGEAGVGERGDGGSVAARLDECRDALAPQARDGDLGLVATLLATVAHRETDPA